MNPDPLTVVEDDDEPFDMADELLRAGVSPSTGENRLREAEERITDAIGALRPTLINHREFVERDRAVMAAVNAAFGESGEPYDAPMTDGHSTADSLSGESGEPHRPQWSDGVPNGWCECGQPYGHTAVGESGEPTNE